MGTTLYSFDFNAATAGIAINGASNVYVTKQNGNTIERITQGGINTVFADNGLAAPFGLAIDADGALYVANSAANNVGVFTPGGNGSTIATSAQGVNGPTFIAILIVPEPAAWTLSAMTLFILCQRRRR